LIADGSIFAYLRQNGTDRVINGTDRVIVALNFGKAKAEVPLPAEIDGSLERLYGKAEWFKATGGVHLTVPGESAAIFRLAGH
jgi:hypothetical protein